MTRFNVGAAQILGLLVVSSACGLSSTPPDDTHAAPAGTPYRATLTASPACADKLPEGARERTYTATLLSMGFIAWSGPTLHPPSWHATISNGALSESSFTFSIDVPRDPQDDGFNGIRDDLADGGIHTISGKGAGTVEGARVAGTLEGTFAFSAYVVMTWSYCMATEHRFTFISE